VRSSLMTSSPTSTGELGASSVSAPVFSPWSIRIPVLAWVLMSLPAFFVLPAGDDWRTSSPLFALEWNALRPNMLWRPFEPVVRRLIGFAATMVYPSALHALVIVGHAMTGFFVYRLLREARTTAWAAGIATALVLIFPGAGAAVWSVDSAVQTWSTGCGLWSVFLLATRRQHRWPLAWLAPAFLSMVWKESGTAWPIAAPCLVALIGSWTQPLEWRRTCRALTLGIGLLACYLLIRTSLAQTGGIGAAAGRYSLSLSPVVLGRNFGMLGAVALLPIDTLALLGSPRNLGLAATTAAAGIPLLLLCVWACIRTLGVARIFLATASLVVIAVPHLVLEHVSEMYAHPLIAGAALVFLPALCAFGIGRRVVTAGAACAFLGALLSDAHKLTAMIEAGHSASDVGIRIVAEHAQAPRIICAVPAVNFPAGYSVFQISPGPASGWGASAQQAWGWSPRTEYLRLKSIEECQAQHSDVTVLFAADGAFTFVSVARQRVSEQTTKDEPSKPD